MNRQIFAILCLAVAETAPAAAQTTITVGQGGGYDYSTIQAAIDAATTGDTVIVFSGVYYENTLMRGKNIILQSTDPTSAAIVAATIIDGKQARPAVRFNGAETSACVVSGFTLRNGRHQYGGVVGNGTLATIQYNVIAGNAGAGRGVELRRRDSEQHDCGQLRRGTR